MREMEEVEDMEALNSGGVGLVGVLVFLGEGLVGPGGLAARGGLVARGGLLGPGEPLAPGGGAAGGTMCTLAMCASKSFLLGMMILHLEQTICCAGAAALGLGGPGGRVEGP